MRLLPATILLPTVILGAVVLAQQATIFNAPQPRVSVYTSLPTAQTFTLSAPSLSASFPQSQPSFGIQGFAPISPMTLSTQWKTPSSPLPASSLAFNQIYNLPLPQTGFYMPFAPTVSGMAMNSGTPAMVARPSVVTTMPWLYSQAEQELSASLTSTSDTAGPESSQGSTSAPAPTSELEPATTTSSTDTTEATVTTAHPLPSTRPSTRPSTKPSTKPSKKPATTATPAAVEKSISLPVSALPSVPSAASSVGEQNSGLAIFSSSPANTTAMATVDSKTGEKLVAINVNVAQGQPLDSITLKVSGADQLTVTFTPQQQQAGTVTITNVPLVRVFADPGDPRTIPVNGGVNPLA